MNTCHHNFHRVFGGVDFLVHGEGCLIEITEGTPYQPFTLRYKSEEEHAVTVTVRAVPTLPETPDRMQPILDGDDWWRMFSGADEYELRFHNRLDGTEHLLARVDRFTREVSVYHHNPAAGAAGEPPTIADPLCNPLDQILVMNHLAYRKGMIVHSAGVIMGSSAFLFAGISGAGKTTMTRLFTSAAPDAKLLSDDRIIVRKTDGSYLAYGTPWPGDAGAAVNDCESLKGVFFLTKANRPEIVPLSPAHAAKRLFPVISCPWYDRERFPHVLETCEDLIAEVPCFELRFCPEESAVRLLRSFVRNECSE
jgi:hypothetical protein